MLSVSTITGFLVSKCLDIPVMVNVMYKTTKSNPRMKRRVYLRPSSWWISLKNVTITDRVSCLSFVDDFSNLRKWPLSLTSFLSELCLSCFCELTMYYRDKRQLQTPHNTSGYAFLSKYSEIVHYPTIQQDLTNQRINNLWEYRKHPMINDTITPYR